MQDNHDNVVLCAQASLTHDWKEKNWRISLITIARDIYATVIAAVYLGNTNFQVTLIFTLPPEVQIILP